jgi:hypothetical protein
MEGPMSKKTNEPPNGKPQREHQVCKPPSVVRSNQIRKGEDILKGHLA